MESSVLHHCRFTPAVVVTFMAVEWRADPASANTPLGALIIQPVSGPGYGWILQLLSLRAAPAGAVLRIPGLHRVRCEDLSILMPIQTSLPRFSSIPTPLVLSSTCTGTSPWLSLNAFKRCLYVRPGRSSPGAPPVQPSCLAWFLVDAVVGGQRAV